MKRGAWNHLIVAYGPPQCGKTYYAVRRLRELARTPAHAFVHDPHWCVDGALRFTSLVEVQAEVRKGGTVGRIIALPIGGDEAAAVAKETGLKSLATKEAHPVVLMLDEGAAVGGFNPYRLGGAMRDLITQRRHYHVGLIVTLQSAALGHYSLSSLATEIVVFKTTSFRDLESLSKCGFPEDRLYHVPELPQFAYVWWKPQTGESGAIDRNGNRLPDLPGKALRIRT